MSLTKEQFIEKLVNDRLQAMTVLSKIDKDDESEKFFSLITTMSQTFDMFKLEKPEYFDSWTIHDEIVEALERALNDLKENHTDDGRG